MSSWRLDVLQRLEEARLVSEIQKSSPYLRLDFSSLARNPVELKAALGTMAAALGNMTRPTRVSFESVLRREKSASPLSGWSHFMHRLVCLTLKWEGQWESFLDALIAENKVTPERKSSATMIRGCRTRHTTTGGMPVM